MIARLLLVFLLSVPCARGATEIQFWHAMSGALGEQTEALVQRFNASQDEVRVVTSFKGGYDETLQSALAAQLAGKGPHVVQVYDGGTANMVEAKHTARPLWQVMAEAGQHFDARAYMPAVASYFSDDKGRLLALPFNTSTPVLYYNKDAFRRAKLDPEKPPKTWYEIIAMLGELSDSGRRCAYVTAYPSWVLLENMSAWHNQEFATKENGLGGTAARLNFNSRLMVRWISMLSTWVKAGYFTPTGRTNEAERKFVSGECSVLTTTSAAYAQLRRDAKFDFGVAQLPYYDDFPEAPQNTLIGGAGLWAMEGKKPAEYRAVARFFAFLSQPEVQAEWHERTGYVPITRAAYERARDEGFYARNPGYEVAIRQLLLRNPTRDSKGIRLGFMPQIRNIIEEELEAVWAQRKTPKDALDAAVARGNDLLQRFELAHRHGR